MTTDIDTNADTDTIRPLRDFVTGMTALVAQDLPEAALLPEVRALMARLIAHDRWLPEPFTRPGQGTYAQHLLHCDPLERFSVVSFVWGPGQRTPVHNHTVWGVVGVLRGLETCEEYAPTPEGARFSGHTHALKAGAIEAVSPTVGDWHRVGNALPDQTSISIHVYGGNIGAIHRSLLDANGVQQPFVSGYSSTVVPNLWDRSAEVRKAVS
jgi:predicted metal-dependent enzyme (double-stranded beta helix superfamily)